MGKFTHLHLHTQYSLLDGSCKISELPKILKDQGMDACAITDHGNMFGVIEFYKTMKANGIKPIIGCEVYVAPHGTTRFDKKGNDEGEYDRKYNHLILLAKNKIGYKNLMKIVSLGWTEGFYYKPRVDMDVLKEYHEGLICSSACLGGAVPQALMYDSYEKAKEIALEHKEIFGEDYYLEVQNHGLREQLITNPDIIRIGKELGIKVIATCDSHYLRKEDYDAHEVLLAIQTSSTINDPNRFSFPTNEFYVKSPEEMMELFKGYPEVVTNTQEIVDKCDFEMEFGNIHLPDYEYQKDKFNSEYDFFKNLIAKGLIERYGNGDPRKVSKEVKERARYELDIIEKMHFIGYFNIVSDFIRWAKDNDIPVGPGRGSAAGSIVAYATHITDIDPIKYNLLFERFLNPERVTFPDIDVDFCYDRRGEVIDYVAHKYGKEKVSQIVTFGTMAARMAIRDVARAMGIPISVADKIAKSIPEENKMTLKKALELSQEFKGYYDNPEYKNLIDTAMKIEGSPRHTSKHAAGVIIADDDISEYAPLMTADGEPVVQFPMTQIEGIGLIKMDFLGLRTLTVIKDTCDAVYKKTGKKIDLKDIIIHPEKYTEVYPMLQEGNTQGVFQFESSGMTELLGSMYNDASDLKYVKTEEEKEDYGKEFFNRLVAAVALYRPGPMDVRP